MRLDKMLAHMGYGSRKEVKELIRKGFVCVNDEVILDDDYKIDEEQDEVVCFDEKLNYEEKLYFLLNKPQGYISTTKDGPNPSVISLIEGYDSRGLFPVGRLDKDTTGLLLISNDGELAHELLAPKKHVNKVYELTFVGKFENKYIQLFLDGILLEDGTKCLPAQLELIDNNRAKITIREGKYHQIKRMFLVLGMEVVTLKRIAFGGLTLPDDLEEGSYIKLNLEDIAKIKGES